MIHPLDGASIRIERADKHLNEVIAEIKGFRQTLDDGITVEYDKVGHLLIRSPCDPLPSTISLAVSDCIHNFRAALDYLIYELARHDSGAVQNGTQFPICDSVADFQRLAPRYLRGLSQGHVHAIETYQPYNGIDWTKTLRDVSNPDKHRELVDVNGPWSTSYILTPVEPDSADGLPGKVFKGVDRDGWDVHVERKQAIQIAFRDGVPVVETLETLKTQLANTIEAFKPEFKV
jgi:hypothetical protein